MGHRTFVQQKMGHERKKVENHCSRPMRCFPKFDSWDCFVRLHYEVIVFPLRNFTELKFVFVTSQSCLLRFGVNFACHVTSLFVSF